MRIYRFMLWFALIGQIYFTVPDKFTIHLIGLVGILPIISNFIFNCLLVSLLIIAIIKEKMSVIKR